MAEIRRVATLIECPDAPKLAKLKGTAQDVRHLRSFLLSPFGGAWKQSEIVTLTNPTKAELEARTRLVAGADYAVTFFTGHGVHNVRTVDDTVYLADKTIPVAEFAPLVARQTMIVDSCREFDVLAEERTMEFSAAVLKMARTHPTDQYIATCRAEYNRIVMSAAEGRSTIYACSLNQTAGESAEGGYFISALLSLNEAWAEGVFSGHSGVAPTSCLQLPAAFQLAYDHVVAKHRPQRPDLQDGKRSRSFPFVIA